MNILVTGCAGFIGSHLSHKLMDQGHTVYGIDNLHSYKLDNNLKLDNLHHLHRRPRFKFLKKNFQDIDKQDLGLTNFDHVVHLAAYAGVRESIENPVAYIDNNIGNTVKLFDILKSNEVKSYIVASSSSVYGKNINTQSEHTDYLSPLSPYGLSKKSMEDFLKNYSSINNKNITCLRFFTVYGPRQRPEMAIHKFIKRSLLNDDIVLFGDGSSYRDYTYIDDICDGILLSIQDTKNKLRYKVYNLGNDKPICLLDLVNKIRVLTNTKSKLVFSNKKIGDVEGTCADISQARFYLNYKPKISIDLGLRKTINWAKLYYGEQL